MESLYIVESIYAFIYQLNKINELIFSVAQSGDLGRLSVWGDHWGVDLWVGSRLSEAPFPHPCLWNTHSAHVAITGDILKDTD